MDAFHLLVGKTSQGANRAAVSENPKIMSLKLVKQNNSDDKKIG